MIIHEPHLKESEDETTVAAAVEVEGRDRFRDRDAAYPDTLWFTFPSRWGKFVTTSADGFAAGLLPLAMQIGEDLTVEGDVSYRLAHGMREYQEYQAAWKPDFFRTVEVRCDELRARDTAEVAGAVGASFSGGVDSFHTLWRHLPENEPLVPYRITHCLMMNGFDADTDLCDPGSFERIARLYVPLLGTRGIELVVVRSNIMDFLGLCIQKQSFPAITTAAALVLGRLFSRFYVPSSYHFKLLSRFPDGSHPIYDHLLATETMETIHDGGCVERVAKTVELATWPETYDLLRVCFSKTGLGHDGTVVTNCCECEKCLRTMATLEIAGALGKYRCFPRPLTPSMLRRLDYWFPGGRVFADEVIAFAKRNGRNDIARNLRWAVFYSGAYRGWVRAIVLASWRLQQRSTLYAFFVKPLKWLIRKTGMGRGWLY